MRAAAEPNFALTPDEAVSFDESVGAAYLASLFDYQNPPIEVQLGPDQSVGTEWQKYVDKAFSQGWTRRHTHKMGTDR